MKLEQRFDAASEGNLGPIIRWVVLWAIVLAVVGTGVRAVLFPLHYANRVATVVAAQIDPAVLLKKYEWFKDAHAALDAKIANIRTYERRFVDTRTLYGPVAAKWPRDVREQYAIWQSEVSGVVASYNDLAAEYNSQMAKINWRFTNRGDLPAGATDPLPRAYVPYSTGESQ